MENFFQTSYFSSVKLNNHGQSLIMLIIALPLFVLMLSLSLTFYKVLQQKSQSLHVCRTKIIHYQNHLSSGLNSLLKLNPQAEFLRTKRKNAEFLYKVAKKTANPKAIAAAFAYRLKVIAEQKAFSLLQELTLWKTNMAAQYQFTKLKLKMNNLNYVSNLNSNGPVLLQVKKKPRNSLTPNYIVRSQYSKKQNIYLSWKIAQKLKTTPLTFRCGATSIKENGKWKSSLSQKGK